MITSSPDPANAERAAQNAWLQPCVIATSSAAISPPYAEDHCRATSARNSGMPRTGPYKWADVSVRAASAIACRNPNGGGSTGAAWLTLINGRSGAKVTPSSQRRASITGGAKVPDRFGFNTYAIASHTSCCRLMARAICQCLTNRQSPAEALKHALAKDGIRARPSRS